MSKIEVNTVDVQSGSSLTLGSCGKTITIPAGATISNLGTAAGFGSTGEVSWNTTKITADPGPAVSGVGYFTDTSGGSFNLTLPASPSAGNVVAVADYANTWDTNVLTILRNGSNIEGSASDFIAGQEGASLTFVYVDATKGWIVTNSGNSSDGVLNPAYVAATGGNCVSTSGNFKIHKFTGPGTFTVTCAGNPVGSNTVDYLVVGGGGGGGGSATGYYSGGGGGAGGFRASSGAASGCYTAGPGPLVNCVAAIPVTAQGYPITVGAGVTGGGGSGSPDAPTCRGNGNDGNPSTALGITSTGGGGGGRSGSNPGATSSTGAPGGSGGGGGGFTSAPTPQGIGNTPPTTPPQGQDGGEGMGPSAGRGAGGGGAGGSGSPGGGQTPPGPGGAGVVSCITASPVTYAPGGDSGTNTASPTPDPAANIGAGGKGGNNNPPGACGSNGGSGIVIIRYRFQ